MTLQPIDQHIDALAAARDAIAACGTPGEAMEAVARVAAAKAWAKAHGTLRDLRLQLLTLEVEALIRVIELGGGHLLSPTERAAGEALAAMTPEARDLLVTTDGTSIHGALTEAGAL